ncbi:MAG: DsbA family protein [Roseiflexus sp.]|nr:DsbA family protein [Roseiflexus sp.]
MINDTPRYNWRRRGFLVRLALLTVLLLIVAACGPEAPQATDLRPTAIRQAVVVRPSPSDAARPRPLDVTPIPASTVVPGNTQVSEPAPSDDPRAQGAPDAPITVVEFSDFQCPFCASFAREVRPLIEERYVRTGKVRLVYRDFPLMSIHPGALLAAHIANCAGEQGAFWQMHARIFEGMMQREWSSGDVNDFRTFLRYAEELELDAGAVQQCVESNRYGAQIQEDILAGQQAGIRSTPSFLINGQLLVGAQPFEVWEQIFERILSTQKP